jgi:hypothetical protein
LQLKRVIQKLILPVSHSQLDASDLVHTKWSNIAAEWLERANLDRFAWGDVYTANRVGTFERWVGRPASA